MTHEPIANLRPKTIAFIAAFKAAIENNPAASARALAEAFGMSSTPYIPGELVAIGALESLGNTSAKTWRWLTSDTPEQAKTA